MKIRPWSVLTILAFLVVARTASAASPNTIWSASGASCAPAQASSSSTYSTNKGAVVVTGASATIFYCPIEHELRQSNGTSNTLALIYKGTSNYPCTGLCTTNLWILVELVALSRSTGSESIVVSLLNTTAASITTISSGFSYTYDFDSNLYYVRITAYGTSSSPEYVYGVALKDS